MKDKEGYSQRYEEALRVATVAHYDQKRKGSGLPYIVHPVQVSVILLRHGFPVEVAVAGLLHDVVEDQGYDLAEIRERFGTQVAEIVDVLSERKRDAQGMKRPWEVRKQEALEQIHRASPEAVAVKVADALHNTHAFVLDLRRRGPGLWQHFNRGPEAQLDYYSQVLQMARDRLGDHPLVEELASALEEMARLIEEAGSDGERE